MRLLADNENLIQRYLTKLCEVKHQNFSCMVMPKKGDFEHMVRNTAMNISLLQRKCIMVWLVFSATSTGKVLHCEQWLYFL